MNMLINISIFVITNIIIIIVLLPIYFHNKKFNKGRCPICHYKFGILEVDAYKPPKYIYICSRCNYNFSLNVNFFKKYNMVTPENNKTFTGYFTQIYL